MSDRLPQLTFFQLPPCPYRIWPDDGQTKRMLCMHPKVHTPGCEVFPRWCRLCDRFDDTVPPREVCDTPAKRPSAVRLDCLHLGEPTGELVECQTCTGKQQLKVFTCQVHGGCTIAKPVEGRGCCATCGDYQRAATSGSADTPDAPGESQTPLPAVDPAE